MKTVFHILTGSVAACDGGMEQSVSRIAEHFLAMGRTKVCVYLRDSDQAPEISNGARLSTVVLKTQRAFLEQALAHSSVARDAERYRTDRLLFRNALLRQREQDPSFRHLIVSFYISNAGFIAQHVAKECGIRHIACVRGTDFSRDFYSPYRFHAIEFVLRHADWIVASNGEQERLLRERLGRAGQITTIYNAWEGPLTLRWKPSGRKTIRLFSDCGYSYKKGTVILLQAFSTLLAEGHALTLCIVGRDEPGESSYWEQTRAEYSQRLGRTIDLRNWVPRDEVERLILASDVYCTASLGEGCSNALNQAMALGIPVAGTRCGAAPELAGNAVHISLSPPGDLTAYTNSLRQMVHRTQSTGVTVDEGFVQGLRDSLSLREERFKWERVVAQVLPKADTANSENRQRRVLFFVHDGLGLGHLQRVSRLARSLQGPCACLIVTGHRAAAWIVPEECEYVHLPSLDSILPDKSGYWGRRPFVNMTRAEGIAFRNSIIREVFEAFMPDAIVVDYLPLGKNEELRYPLERSGARKYFLMRGVLDHPDNVRQDILGGRGEEFLETVYDRIFVACDVRICDVATEYGFRERIADRIRYIGYVSEPMPEGLRSRVRMERGIGPHDIWVVCSAGGGALGEQLLRECESCAHALPQASFDLVFGPRSGLEWTSASDISANQRVRFVRESRYLSRLHGSCDIVICSGGYNSLMEAMEGGARIICVPTQLRTNDEQAIHSQRLARFYPISLVLQPAGLMAALQHEMGKVRQGSVPAARSVLQFSGIDEFRKMLFEDMGILNSAGVALSIR